MKRSGFRGREVDYDCYLNKLSSSKIILVLVDVVFIVGLNTHKIIEIKMQLTREFKITNQTDAKLKKVLSMIKLANECIKMITTGKLKLVMASAAFQGL